MYFVTGEVRLTTEGTGNAYLLQGEGSAHGSVSCDGLISPWLRLLMLEASFLLRHSAAEHCCGLSSKVSARHGLSCILNDI